MNLWSSFRPLSACGYLDLLRRLVLFEYIQGAVSNVSSLPCLHLAGKPPNEMDTLCEDLRGSDYHCHFDVNRSLVRDLD